MSEDQEETKVCYNEEYKQELDDCGSCYCSLTGAKWDEWNYEDNCAVCPFAASPDYDELE